jgi:hypothetical protein
MNPVKIVTKRTAEQLEELNKIHTHILMAVDDFVLLNSPLGPIFLDKIHPDFNETLERCIIWCKLNNDYETAKKYESYKI